MYHSHDGSCKNYMADHEHPMAIPWAFLVIIGQATCENFHSFPLLPLKLKCKICRHALPESRILELVNRGPLPGYITYFAVVPLSGGYNSSKRNFGKIMRALVRVCREFWGTGFQNYSIIRLKEAPIASLWNKEHRTWTIGHREHHGSLILFGVFRL